MIRLAVTALLALPVAACSSPSAKEGRVEQAEQSGNASETTPSAPARRIDPRKLPPPAQ